MKLTKKSKFVTNESDYRNNKYPPETAPFYDSIEDKKAEAICTLFEDEINTVANDRDDDFTTILPGLRTFRAAGDKNVAYTILVLSMRTAEYT